MKQQWRNMAYAVLAAALLAAGLLGSQGEISASWHGSAAQQTVPAVIQLAVTLQRPNSPPPSLPWAVPIRVGFYAPGSSSPPLYAWDELWLDQSGIYRGVLGVAPGTYDVRVKNMHTLRNVKRNVAVSGSTTIDMGTLLEGDADDDNRVRASDFTLLRAAYFTNEGDPGFDPRCDFDEDNRIRSSDFALLRANYFLSGDIEVPTAFTVGGRAARVDSVALAVEPAVTRVAVGETFILTLAAHAGEQPFATLDADIRFPPTLLQVVGPDGDAATEIVPLPPVNNISINRVDNVAGRILYGAGTDFFGDPAWGDVPLAQIRFRALQAAPAAEIRLVDGEVSDPDGVHVTGALSGAIVRIGSGNGGVYLPLILR